MRVLFTAQDQQTIRDASVGQNQMLSMLGFTPLLWRAARPTRSTISHSLAPLPSYWGKALGCCVGRVKTPTLAIACTRELEIRDFVPLAYFEVVATAKVLGGQFPMRHAPQDGIVRREIAQDIAPLIHNHVVRVEVQSDQLVIELANAKGSGPKRKRSRNVIEVPWHKTPSTRRREVLVPEAGPRQDARPIRSENREILVASIARGRRWLDELIADPTANTESIAGREGCSVRKVNMTISLAFLAPDLVKAAIDGRLPHGMGVARLCDLPAEWSRQRQMLGLAAL